MFCMWRPGRDSYIGYAIALATGTDEPRGGQVCQVAVAFSGADIAHAFALTEAGVAFDVRDGLAGFPAALILVAGDAMGKVPTVLHNSSKNRYRTRIGSHSAGPVE